MAPLISFTSLATLSMMFVFVEAQVPAMFVFGDSLLDPGNNNNLATLAKANYFPNGIDFPEGVTGRYCNGRTVADYLGNLLGLPLIPPYNKPIITAHDTSRGVNFASAAAGILNDTGKLYGDRFSMDSQIQNFKRILEGLSSALVNGTEDYISRSLFLVCMGSNDYINNFLLPLSQTASMYTAESFAELLIHEYSRQLKELYELGARKFLIGGLGPLGCIPNQIGNYQNASNIAKGQIICLPILPLECENRSDFIFWDPYHPTDRANSIVAEYAYNGTLQASFPMNAMQLALL
ncbi:GDSL esterase/lipase [Carex littledalei]|uniref:GDSL esterase/lipase n=1 Tax=Carex littledalei TaxID=544730 RepID=A0A833RFP4_9POAL|nr:GDSL esterase/lipase [Carex littledalei]